MNHRCALSSVVLAFITFATSGSAQQPEPAGPIGLAKALKLALEHNPDLAVFGWDMRIADARQLQAGLRPNPELGLEIEEIRVSDGPRSVTTTTVTGSPGFEREVQEGAPAGFGEAELTLRLSQLIELGGKRARRIRAAGLEGDVFRWEYEIARADVLTRVASTFTAVLGAQERTDLAAATVALAEDVVRTINARVEAGRVSPLEATRAEVELNQARIAQSREERALEAARIRLASLWDSRSPAFTRAEGTLEHIEDVLPVEALERQVSESPEIQFWAAELDRRDALTALEKAQRIPDLTVSVGYRNTGLESRDATVSGVGTTPSGVLATSRTGFDDDRDHSFVFEFSLPLPLFNRNQGAIKEAEYLSLKGAARQRATENRIRAALKAMHQELEAAADEVEALRNEVLPRAAQSFDATNEGYTAGKFAYLDVLEAQRTLVGARGQYIDALVRYHQARIRIERLAGIDPVAAAPADANTPEGAVQ